MKTEIVPWQGKSIRKTLHNNEWWFVVEDLVLTFTDSKDPRQYVHCLKMQDSELGKGWGQIATPLSIVTPNEHKELKKLKRENLRDHMTDMELIFSMLGEAATTEITRANDAHVFDESRTAARKGGEVAGVTRKDLEKKTGKRVVSPENYLT